MQVQSSDIRTNFIPFWEYLDFLQKKFYSINMRRWAEKNLLHWKDISQEDHKTRRRRNLKGTEGFGPHFFSLFRCHSVTRLVNFLKSLATHLLTKVAEIFDYFLGYFEKHHVLSKAAVATFRKNWLLFIMTYGHTDIGDNSGGNLVKFPTTYCHCDHKLLP